MHLDTVRTIQPEGENSPLGIYLVQKTVSVVLLSSCKHSHLELFAEPAQHFNGMRSNLEIDLIGALFTVNVYYFAPSQVLSPEMPVHELSMEEGLIHIKYYGEGMFSCFRYLSNSVWFGIEIGAGKHLKGRDGLHEMSQIAIHVVLIDLQLLHTLPHLPSVVAACLSLFRIASNSSRKQSLFAAQVFTPPLQSVHLQLSQSRQFGND